MTTTSPERISLASPAALCAAVPHLLGFVPEHSAVIVWLSGGRIMVTQRIDLPRQGVPLESWTTQAWSHVGAGQADELVLVICCDDNDGLPLTRLARAVARRARVAGQGLRDVLLLSGGRWRSLHCRDSSCCPSGGRPIPEDLACAVAAEFVAEGRVSRGSRGRVVGEFEPDPLLAAEVEATGILGRLRRPGVAARERWRDWIIASTLAWLRDPDSPATPARMAHLLRGLQDIRVRDTVLWELSRWGLQARHVALGQLTRVVVAAPGSHVAAPASVAAVAAWLVGDGVRARGALARAEAGDASYSLVTLLGTALAHGLPPEEWLRMMASLSRDACRHGRELPDDSDSV